VLAQRDWDVLKFDDVIRFLEDPQIEYVGGGSEPVTLPWELSAGTYLRFARADLSTKSMRGRVNALGNAKRALHCHVDSILYCAGLWDGAQSRRWDFPTRMNLVRQMEVATPDVLRRINLLRNAVEHEYVVPDEPERLRDFIDVSNCLLDLPRSLPATDLRLQNSPAPTTRKSAVSVLSLGTVTSWPASTEPIPIGDSEHVTGRSSSAYKLRYTRRIGE
jgi:hypothetical protein